ncbi:DUF2059 domain-containing protein [Gallaecimonas mangrovi]|uniref:DUF2059 domain-containing protein n=1 Tax=Gallaecimonas mangrovi TaxID=2291597 RepID=UPI000E1FE30B|nr:DUF2059 domain-containing protein [Gallaecimonas mangrovi]
MRNLIAICLMVMAFTAHADQNSKQQKIDQLVKLMHMDKMVDAMTGSMEQMMGNLSRQLGVKPSEQPIFDRYHHKMMALMKEEMNWQKMEPMVASIYDKNFTEKQIDDMVAFYKTDTGQTILKKMPEVMKESIEASQTMAKDMLPKLRKISLELKDELTKARQKDTDQAGANQK